MPYATQADMIERFGEREVIALADRDLDGVIDASVVTGAIDSAGHEIEAHLSGRFSLPLSTVPELLTGICCDITRYRLCGTEVQTTDEVRDRYKDAVKMLEMIRDGKMTLGLDATSQVVGGGDTVLIADGRRTFNKNALSDY